MLNFIKFLLGQYKSAQSDEVNVYDEDGNYLDPAIAKMTNDELMLPADRARILRSKSLDEVKTKQKKKVFQAIHGAIKGGKTLKRIEAYNMTPELATYLESLGYGVRDVVPEPGPGIPRTVASSLFEDDGEREEQVPYHYYIVSWGDAEVVDRVSEA